ncbi:retrotransposon protein, putative, ty1-copia subclass [Tanacetum coccineum]
MDFPEFYKELEAELFQAGTKLMGLQLLQLEIRVRPSLEARMGLTCQLDIVSPVTNIMSPIWSKNCTGFAIGKRYLPIESIIASTSTNVMMAATQTTNNNLIRSILEKEKLNGSNFLDWYRNLRIVLRNEQKLHHVEDTLPEAPPATATAAVRNAYTSRVAEQHEELKTMFQQQAKQELFETVKAFYACKQEEGQSVSTYVLKMKAYLDQMEYIGYPMPLVKSRNLNRKYEARESKKGKGKRKLAYDLEHKIPQPAKKEHPAKDTECHHYHKTGHWKRNCPLYLAELKKNKASTSGTSSIFTIELFSFPKSNTSLDLYVGNGNTTVVEAIGSFHLILPSGMILVLDNFSKDNIVYFNAFPCDGVFKIDMHNHMSNEHSIYTCSNKKTKHNLDYTFLWHCRLGHINKKRIEKLQHDGLLELIDDESFDVCVSCISGKMERKPFTHTIERADDLLGIIHSDVCGPFRTTSREGVNYYVTFTDDLSRYGYVYLIKHKHEVFEMFKTFQNKVENQLEKNIKALRSDRGGEYLSQEFLDHLRSHGIISQLTPPYTPQHNGGYALESAARILNMVPTKKVYKTPYKMWHGKVLNLSYLKFFETRLIKQEASRSTVEFDEIQSEDLQPSKNSSLHQHEFELDTVEPQTDVIPIRRSVKIPQAPKRYSFYIDAEEHELGDHREPPNYRAALSDPKS